MAVVKGLTEDRRKLHVQLKDAILELQKVLLERLIVRVEDVVTLRGEGREALVELERHSSDAAAEDSALQAAYLDLFQLQKLYDCVEEPLNGVQAI